MTALGLALTPSPLSSRPESGGACPAFSATSSTPSLPAPSAVAYAVPLVLLAFGLHVLRGPDHREATNRLAIGTVVLAFAACGWSIAEGIPEPRVRAMRAAGGIIGFLASSPLKPPSVLAGRAAPRDPRSLRPVYPHGHTGPPDPGAGAPAACGRGSWVSPLETLQPTTEEPAPARAAPSPADPRRRGATWTATRPSERGRRHRPGHRQEIAPGPETRHRRRCARPYQARPCPATTAPAVTLTGQGHPSGPNDAAAPARRATALAGDVTYTLPDSTCSRWAARTRRFGSNDRVVDSLTQVFEQFDIDAQVTGFSRGPTVTRYEVEPAPAPRSSASRRSQEHCVCRGLGRRASSVPPIPASPRSASRSPTRTARSVSSATSCAARSPAARPPDGHGGRQGRRGRLRRCEPRQDAAPAGRRRDRRRQVELRQLDDHLDPHALHPDEVRLVLVDPKRVGAHGIRGRPAPHHADHHQPQEGRRPCSGSCARWTSRYDDLAAFGFKHVDDFNKAVKAGRSSRCRGPSGSSSPTRTYSSSSTSWPT